MSTLESAVALAARAHEGQVDKAGEPYLLHPLRVMLRLSTTDERAAAVLHDVLEDSPTTLDDLRSAGFSETIVEAVNSLTKRPGESYDDFVLRAGANPIGRRVKLADLADNCDLSRLTAPTEEDNARVAKYRRAVAILLAQGCQNPAAMPSSVSGSRPPLTLAQLTGEMNRFVAAKGWYDAASRAPQTPRNIAASLSIEAAEVLEHFQWSESPRHPDELPGELADVALYLLQLAYLCGIDLEQAILDKLAANYRRTWPKDAPALDAPAPEQPVEPGGPVPEAMI